MKRAITTIFALFACILSAPMSGQTPRARPAPGVKGVVIKIDTEVLTITVRTDKGGPFANVTITLSASTNIGVSVGGMPPSRIAFADVKVGDLVSASGNPSDDHQTLVARSVTVIRNQASGSQTPAPLPAKGTPTNAPANQTRVTVQAYNGDLEDITLSPVESQWFDPERGSLIAALRSLRGETSPKDVAELAWKAELSQCSRDGFPSPSFFWVTRNYKPNEYPRTSGAEPGITIWELQEFLGTLAYPDPKGETLSEAERLNGVQWRGSTSLKVSSSRRFVSYFDKGRDRLGQSQVLSVYQVNKWSEFEDWSRAPASWPTIHLEKKNNKWSFSPYPKPPYESVQFKVSCATATAADPFSAR
jgi:hypothetical protein